MRTSHLSDDKGNTACGEPWEAWQEPGVITAETTAMMTPRELQEEREQPRGLVRQCQACLKRAVEQL